MLGVKKYKSDLDLGVCNITINDDMITVSFNGYPTVIKKIESYNTYYVLVYKDTEENKFGVNKFLFENENICIISRKEIFEKYNFTNLVRLKSECRFLTPIQLDTGIVSNEHNKLDAIISLYGVEDSYILNTEYDVSYYKTYSIDNISLKLEETSRYEFMNSYSLSNNNVEYKSTYTGDNIDETDRKLSLIDKEYFDINVKKYKGINFESLCNFAYDQEKLCVETTSGVLNTSIISLNNGCGEFRLYPLGYKGEAILTLKYLSGEIVGIYKFNIE